MAGEVPSGPIRAFQWDLARQVERLDWLLAQLPRYAEWGYQELYLHLEDAVEYPSLPGVARKDAYGYRELAALVMAADRVGIGVVPIVNLWGHTQYLLKVPELRELNELRAADGSALPAGQICPLHPRTLEVAARLIGDLAPFCTTGKVHVGLDESYAIGRHPRSRAEISRIGLGGHFAKYVRRLEKLTRSFDLRLGLWADMLALMPEAISPLPAGIAAYDWYYYPFRRRPRLEIRNFREYDIAPALRARGIGYWGCPMNGAFRHEPLPIFRDRLENIVSWWRRCRAVGAEGFLVTSWEPNRLAIELTTVVDAAAASLWLDGADDATEMLEKGFARVLGRAGAGRAARAALGCDRRPFSGYARWEINSRWDASAGREGPGPYERELRFFSRRWTGLPGPLAASIAFRRYLAARDVFVRRAARGVFAARRAAGAERRRRQIDGLRREAKRFRREIAAGRAAARTIWRFTRNPGERGPNELIVAEDAVRLGGWVRWLARARRNPAWLEGSTPVCGAWQFRCLLGNFAPALQQVVLEVKDAEKGGWVAVNRRFLIEFQAGAAARRTRITREFTAPLADLSKPVRLALRGVGQVRVSGVEFSDGRRRLRLRGKRILGRPPAPAGFPRLDWMRNLDAWLLPLKGIHREISA